MVKLLLHIHQDLEQDGQHGMMMNQQILSDKQFEIDHDWLVEHFGEEFKDVYCGGASNLSIRWIPVGTQFRIEEYDGSEHVIELENDTIYIA